MPYNVGLMRDMIETRAVALGVERDKLKKNLVYQLIIDKTLELARKSGTLEKKTTLTTDGTEAEFELPVGIVHIRRVDFDSYRAHPILHSQVRELQDQVS